MKFLIDRCAGRLIADWLRKQGHYVVESRELGPDPGGPDTTRLGGLSRKEFSLRLTLILVN